MRDFKAVEKSPVPQRKHIAIQNMKISSLFSFYAGNFCHPGYVSTDPIESGSISDPEPNSDLLA